MHLTLQVKLYNFPHFRLRFEFYIYLFCIYFIVKITLIFYKHTFISHMNHKVSTIIISE